VTLNQTFLLATPSPEKGAVRIDNLKSKKSKTLLVHDTKVHYIKFSKTGKYLMTSSLKGTIIRVFDLKKDVMLQEFR